MGETLQSGPHPESPDALYRALGFAYPKFFKMDLLCKWAWLGAEILLSIPDSEPIYTGLTRSKIAVVLATGAGCLDVDKRYLATMDGHPSPALFVYTLPNIMLGEICIRHGFTGQQLCLVQESPDDEEIYFSASDLLGRGAEACVCGWVDATTDGYAVSMAWLALAAAGPALTTEALQTAFQ